MTGEDSELQSEEPLDLTALEAEDLETAEAQAEPVSYSGQDFDVAGLVQRLERSDILIPSFGHNDDAIESAGFQRAFVWRRPQMDRFIESILLGYPVPGIFLVRQSDKRYLVLDGQQRLSTLRYFKKGLFASREFALKNVSDRFKELTYQGLSDELRRQFDDTFIQATIVVSDGSDGSLESIYQIFERLNSGGTQLTPHEIRIALYAGPFIDFLEDLNRLAAWRELYGIRSPRLRDQELILRIVALHLRGDFYKRPLKKFLNDFVAARRMQGSAEHGALVEAFEKACELVSSRGGRQSFRIRGNQINVAFAEAVMVGLMARLSGVKEPPAARSVQQVVRALKENLAVGESISRSTTDEEQVRSRISAAVDAFAGI